MSITLIIGFPGTGKTTYAKENCKGCLIYDLDYLKTALTYSDVHSADDEDARKVANSFLMPFVIMGQQRNRDLCIIRMAPKLEELTAIKPDKLIVMLTEYDISKREDFHEVDREMYEARITACIKWCDKNGVLVEMKE